MKKIVPLLFILLGVIALFLKNNIYVAGFFIILGIVMIMERIWPSIKDE